MKKNNVGRPSIGITKKYSITLSDDDFHILQWYLKQTNLSSSEFLRSLIEGYIKDQDLRKHFHQSKV